MTLIPFDNHWICTWILRDLTILLFRNKLNLMSSLSKTVILRNFVHIMHINDCAMFTGHVVVCTHNQFIRFSMSSIHSNISQCGWTTGYYALITVFLDLSLGNATYFSTNFHVEPCQVLQILMTLMAKCKDITLLPSPNTSMLM